jgi:hypothetical protein
LPRLIFENSSTASMRVFGHFVPELPFDTQPQGRAVLDGQRLAVHGVGHDGLRIKSIDQIDALVIKPGVYPKLSVQQIGA